MNEPNNELPVFLALKEKAVRLRDKLADKLNEVSEFALVDISRLTTFIAVQNFIDACDKAISRRRRRVTVPANQ
ncbi:MAG TPA: hypothetical protein VGG11_03800 [Xanthobacteraceae bacterium]|jgi:hypothetical protein